MVDELVVSASGSGTVEPMSVPAAATAAVGPPAMAATVPARPPWSPDGVDAKRSPVGWFTKPSVIVGWTKPSVIGGPEGLVPSEGPPLGAPSLGPPLEGPPLEGPPVHGPRLDAPDGPCDGLWVGPGDAVGLWAAVPPGVGECVGP
jgi:hypothetical protein